jgi:uncharacterized protein
MVKQLELVLLPEEAADQGVQLQKAAAMLKVSSGQIKAFRLLKRSIDARSRQVKIRLLVEIYVDETPPPLKEIGSGFLFDRDVSSSLSAMIIGFGPAGMFAALKLIESGIKPVIIERGKDVQQRRRDLAAINKQGTVNPDSNYCFGEGGAGTYSDGKLYTRSNKRGDINRILDILIFHGADPEIRIDAHPHIGTNKLPGLVQAIRQTILNAGGEIHFNTRLEDFIIRNHKLSAIITENVVTNEKKEFAAKTMIVATGHSARDIFEMFVRNEIRVEAKPFAIGVRIEHAQEIIDQVQYHSEIKNPVLPPASYSLTYQYEKRGVYSFCMCPGGIIAPASTAPGEIVVNGWSPSKRNNPFANSGIVASVSEKEFEPYSGEGELRALRFQQKTEKNAFIAGGGKLHAPAQRMIDFVNGKISASLPVCSYIPGVTSSDVGALFPTGVTLALKNAFQAFGKQMKPFYTNEAIIVAAESRTSSPVRIPRDPLSLQHPQVAGIYPCGEGAGYAGGIVSAAMDGELCAGKVAEFLLGTRDKK